MAHATKELKVKKQGAREKGAQHKAWGDEDNERLKVLVDEGKSARAIARANASRGWSISTVKRKVKELKKGGEISRKAGQGRPHVHNHDAAAATMAAMVSAGKETSVSDMAKKCKMSKSTARRILQHRLKFKSVKKVQSKRMSEKTRQKRVERATALKKALEGSNGIDLKKIWWSDESFFRLNQDPTNRNNDRIWIPKHCRKADVPASEIVREVAGPMKGVMVTLSVNYEKGAIAPQIITPGIKICADTYKQSLEDHIFPHIEAAYLATPTGNSDAKSWIWMQDGASSHTATGVAAYLDKYLGKKRWIRDWPPSSPDLNPLDFSLWSVLKSRVYESKADTLPQLKALAMQAAQELGPNLIKEAIAQVPRRLELLLECEGKAFEYKMKKHEK